MHRQVMADIYGEDAIRGKVVMHLCDNPPCINPEHLRIGTQADNMRDMSSKGRGPLPRNTKLTPDDVRAIRRRVATGEQHLPVAADYGIGRNQVWKIVHHQQWRHVT